MTRVTKKLNHVEINWRIDNNFDNKAIPWIANRKSIMPSFSLRL